MNRVEHLMTIAMEECAEVAQRIAKAARFGMNQIQQDANDKPEENPLRLSNRARIVDELNDLMAILEMLGISMLDIDGRKMYAKREKVERYLQRSERCGTLEPSSAASLLTDTTTDSARIGQPDVQPAPQHAASNRKASDGC